MTTIVQKWGNSLAIRLPAPLAGDIAVEEGHAVDLRVTKGRLIVVPVRQKKYALPDLISKITRKNQPHEIGTGERRGRESW